MRRMERIAGRSDDMIILRGVNLFPSQIEALILKCPGLTPHFQLELHRRERMDAVTVVVEARPTAAGEAEREMSAFELKHHIKSVVGVTVGVRVADPGASSAHRARRGGSSISDGAREATFLPLVAFPARTILDDLDILDNPDYV